MLFASGLLPATITAAQDSLSLPPCGVPRSFWRPSSSFACCCGGLLCAENRTEWRTAFVALASGVDGARSVARGLAKSVDGSRAFFMVLFVESLSPRGVESCV